MSLFHLGLLVIFFYIVWRLVWKLPYSLWVRGGLALFLLFASKYHWLQLWIWGSMFSPELPTWAVMLLGGIFGGFVILTLLTVLTDVLLLLGRWVLRIRAAQWTTGLRLSVLISSTVLAVVGVYHAIQVPEVRRVEIHIKDLPPNLQDFKIAHLADLHISHLFKQEWLTEVVVRTNALNPDVIAITGDLIDGFVSDRHDDVAAYADLKARYGVLMSLGNHEYYFNVHAWSDKFRELGMQVLENQHKVIEHNGAQIVFAGVTEETALRFGLEGPDLTKALKGAPATTTVLLDHRPDRTVSNIAQGVNLQLSGHTHGGMIIGFQEIVRMFNNGFVSGLYAVGEGWLYQSNGTGLWNGFPIRLGVPSEITLITLKKR